MGSIAKAHSQEKASLVGLWMHVPHPVTTMVLVIDVMAPLQTPIPAPRHCMALLGMGPLCSGSSLSLYTIIAQSCQQH